MPYTLIRADEVFSDKVPNPKVFLGGNCRGRDWRLDFYHRFEQTEVTFISPKREPFIDPELDPSAHAHQVEWERRAIDEADVAIFWLGDGLVNQAARVEMGYAIGAGKTVLIGAEEGFLGLEHLSAFGGLVLAKSLDGLMNRFSNVLSSYE